MTQAADATPATDGLLSMNQEQAAASPEAATEQPVEEKSAPEPTDSIEWRWAEDIKGEGNKPDWLKEKYKSVSDQAKAYTELEKRLGETKGAPKDGYVFDGIEGLASDDPMLKSFGDTFKELNLTQDGANRLIAEYMTAQKAAYGVDLEAEVKKLGPQANDLIKTVNQRIDNNFNPELAKAMKGWVHTADDMKALQALLSFQTTSSSPTGNQMSSGHTYESFKEVRDEKTSNWSRYQEDTNYRKGLDTRLANAVHRERARKT